MVDAEVVAVEPVGNRPTQRDGLDRLVVARGAQRSP
jgi:hypothetical protein